MVSSSMLANLNPHFPFGVSEVMGEAVNQPKMVYSLLARIQELEAETLAKLQSRMVFLEVKQAKLK